MAFTSSFAKDDEEFFTDQTFRTVQTPRAGQTLFEIMVWCHQTDRGNLAYQVAA